MAEESDGIAEAFDGQLRVALTAAARIGEVIARAREDAVRRAQAASEQQARELSSRLDAERQSVRADLGNVYRPEWWDQATPEQIGQAYTTARAWSGEEPEAVRADGRIRDEVRERYGVDVANTGADPAAVQAAVAESDELRRQADVQRNAGAGEEAEAVSLMQSADAADRSADAAHAEAQPEAGSTTITLTAEELALVQASLDRTATAAENETEPERWEGQEPDAEYIDEKQSEASTARGLSDRLGSEQATQEETRSKAATEAAAHESTSKGAQAAAQPLYDSADRRQATAADLEAKGVDAGTVETRMRADVSQGRPATEAVAGTAGRKAPKARATRARSPQAQRGDVSR